MAPSEIPVLDRNSGGSHTSPVRYTGARRPSAATPTLQDTLATMACIAMNIHAIGQGGLGLGITSVPTGGTNPHPVLHRLSGHLICLPFSRLLPMLPTSYTFSVTGLRSRC